MSDRRRNVFILLVVALFIAGSVAVILTRETKLGLDLQGGVSLVYEAQPTAQEPEPAAESLARAVDIIRERVDALGVAEPEIAQSGQRQIEVNLPAVENAERAAQQVGNTAQMFFYDWEPNILDEDCQTNPDQVNGGQTPIAGFYNAVKRAAGCDDIKPATDRSNASDERTYCFDDTERALNDGLPATDEAELYENLESRPDGGEGRQEGDECFTVPAGVLIVRQERANPDQPRPDAWWVIRDDPVLSGTEIENPEQQFDPQTNSPIVTMEFSDVGKRAFAETTREIANRGADNALPGQDPIEASHRFAIVLDNELISTPYINFQENPDGIDGETGAQISGGFTIQTAQDLAQFLKIGALPVELELISRSQVSATLGRQALDQGLTAAIAGFGVVALFLMSFYRVLGVIAVVALCVYALYLYALVKLIPVVMTLPGIAGLVLTLGVAADANIVVFERVKEEVRAGRPIGAAIAQGYKKGLATIIDANVVTLLVAFILFILATAGVKGFAFMLGLGTIISLFTAVLATQAILLSMRGTRLLRSRQALGAREDSGRFRLDYMGASKWFFSISGLILLIGALAIAGKGLNFGIDFESGSRVRASLERPVQVAEVREALAGTGIERDARIQTVDDPDIPNVVQITTSTLQPEEVSQVEQALDREFGLAESESDSIGPTFGETIATSALYAIIAGLLVISVYITLRFEWKMAVPLLIALSHDILITAGVYAITGREVTASTVAALLTILGYSLYDTIIVFDRIRENIPRMPTAAFSQIVNRSMSEVIVRSLATSFSTLLPVVALFFFGGETLKDFAFALIVGVASGTYSSVFIASPVLQHWKEREPVYRLRRRRIIDALGTVPAFATPLAGGPVDVAPSESRRGRRPVSSDPAQGVSASEFDDMVKNLGVEPGTGVAPPRQRPAGGRRAAGRDGQSTEGDGKSETRPKPEPKSTAARRERKRHGRR